jgi:hypothetical protein
MPRLTIGPGPVYRAGELAGPFGFRAVPWLAGACAGLLVVLIVSGLVREIRLGGSAAWGRWLHRLPRFVFAGYALAWMWLLAAVSVLHHVRDRHAETAGWLLFGVAALTVGAGLVSAPAGRWLPLTLTEMWLVAMIVSAIATGQSGSPEELHPKEPGHVRPAEVVPHGR